MNNTIDNMISDIMAARAAGRTVNSRTGDVTIDMTAHGLNAGPNHGLNAGPNHGLNAGQDPTNPIIIDLVDLVDQDRDHDQVIGKGTYSVVKIINGHAVKIIQNSDSFSSAIREICLLGKLDHPNVIKCNGIGFNFEETHMFMKLYHYSLFTCIKSCNVRLNNFGVVVGIIENILQALTYIHERGIIHCDVKPENILLEELENGFLSAVLCDFGISVLVNEVMHIASVQTTTYRAPEIAFHRDIIKFTPAIDMWSLGCLLFNLFTLKPFVEYAINQSGDYIEDPTWYACKGLNIQGCNTWGTRKKMLRSVNMPYIMFALEHRIDNEVLYCRLYVSGLLQLCAQCFYPNPTKRITAACGLTIVRCISGVKTIYYPPCPRVWTNTKTVDSMRCLRNIIIDVIMSCSARCLNLAEIIYCITLRYEINCPYVEQFSSACIYIASAIYSGESHIVRIINGCDDKKKIIEAVGAILIAIYNDSINVNVATTLANMTGGYY